MKERYFTIDEAREMLPILRELLNSAHQELEERSQRLQEFNTRYLQAEQALDDCQAPDDEEISSLAKFREERSRFELAINDLSREQSEFIRCLEGWVDKITAHGVILRKLREGLLDFPARNGEFKYYLCWVFNEDDITHWHLAEDGYIGRKALVTLSEYY